MYCSYCGSKNEEGNKFCSSCGKELSPPPKKESPTSTGQPLHDSITRKSIKKDAMQKNKSPLYLGYIILFILILVTIFALTFALGTRTSTGVGQYSYSLDLTNTTLINSTIFAIVLIVITSFFSTGMAQVSLDISREKPTTTGNIFKYPIQNIKTYLKILVINLLVYFILTAVSYIPIVGSILYIILTIYFTPILAMFTYVALENKETATVDIIKKSFSIVKGHRIAYYGLIFSFIGWFILSIFTLGLLVIWVAPYLNVSISNFYLSITKEKEFTGAAKGLSDGLIVGLTFASYVIFIVLIVIAVVFFVVGGKSILNENWEILIDDVYDNYEPYHDNHHDSLSGDTINISGIEVYIPDNYHQISETGYDDTYASPREDVMIGLITYDIGYGVTTKDYANIYRESLTDSYSCKAVSTNLINGHNWEVLDCSGTLVNIKSYITIDDGKLYLLTISYDASQNTTINSLYSKIEDELSFANTVA